jgi:hypothetical protein
MSARHNVYLPIYQLAVIQPVPALGYRILCKLCNHSWRWLDQDLALDGFADHLKECHRAHGGRRKAAKAAKSTAT